MDTAMSKKRVPDVAHSTGSGVNPTWLFSCAKCGNTILAGDRCIPCAGPAPDRRRRRRKKKITP